MGYRSITAPKRCHRPPDRGLPVLPNLLNRDFQVGGRQAVWVSDITQVRCLDGWLYLAIVLDLSTRSVVGWATGRINNAELVGRALEHAERKAGVPAGLMFHSDQGVQYHCEATMSWLNDRDITISMSRVGNCRDNACAESFFSLMKKEWTRPLGLLDRAELRGEIENYIETYYTKIRCHESLQGKTPEAFRTEYLASRSQPGIH